MNTFIAWAQANASDTRIAVVGMVVLGVWTVLDFARHDGIDFNDNDEVTQ